METTPSGIGAGAGVSMAGGAPGAGAKMPAAAAATAASAPSSPFRAFATVTAIVPAMAGVLGEAVPPGSVRIDQQFTARPMRANPGTSLTAAVGVGPPGTGGPPVDLPPVAGAAAEPAPHVIDPVLLAQRLAAQDKQQENREEKDVAQADKADTFADYRPKHPRIAAFGGCHPDPVVETSAMASVAAPRFPSLDAMKLVIPREVIEHRMLSSLQLETIIYAKRRHELMLPDGSRSGFLLGDGAGMGKGRQIAGLISETFRRGRKRALWFSASGDLARDAERDFQDIGAGHFPLESLAVQSYEPLENKFPLGVLFSTYSSLIGSTKSEKKNRYQNRLDQVVDWFCQGDADFDGVLVFDECHKAKNCNLKNAKKGSKTAQAVIDVQRRLPQARVVYVSATAATKIEEMGYMDRLGLWGTGTAFPSANEFKNNVAKRGTGAMELVAMDLKARGMLLARTLAYRGADFEIKSIELPDGYGRTYDKCCKVWYDIKGCVDEAIAEGHMTKKSASGQLWGGHQDFFKQLCLGAKIGALVELAKEALDNDMCVVIGLQGTGEARFEAALRKHGLDERALPSSARSLLEHSIDNLCAYATPEKRQRLHDSVRELELPPNPLDYLIDELGGPGMVAEMTGRKQRIVKNAGRYTIEKRVSSANGGADSLNVTERKAFQDGSKLVAIISDAASTGVSLQADRRVKNQRRRCHFTLELAWSADKSVQQLGRSHRSNQSSAPSYCLLVSDIGAERRFSSAVAARLQALGALTKGDRRSTANMKENEVSGGMQDMAISPKRAAKALVYLYEDVVSLANGRLSTHLNMKQYDFLCQDLPGEASRNRDVDDPSARKLDRAKCQKWGTLTAGVLAKVELLDKKTWRCLDSSKDYTRFLNRLFGVHLVLQNQLYMIFTDALAKMKADDAKEGIAEGIIDVAGNGFAVARSEVVFADPGTGAAAQLVEYTSDRGIAWEDALAHHCACKAEKRMSAFLIKKNSPTGYPSDSAVREVALAIGEPTNDTRRRRPAFFKYMKPNMGRLRSPEHSEDLRRKWKIVKNKADMARVEELWKEVYAQSESQCTHYNCSRLGCQVGVRKKSQYMIAGAMLGIWNDIAQQVDTDKMKIVRLTCDDSTRLVGIHLGDAASHKQIRTATSKRTVGDTKKGGEADAASVAGPAAAAQTDTTLARTTEVPDPTLEPLAEQDGPLGLWEQIELNDHMLRFTVDTTILKKKREKTARDIRSVLKSVPDLSTASVPAASNPFAKKLRSSKSSSKRKRPASIANRAKRRREPSGSSHRCTPKAKPKPAKFVPPQISTDSDSEFEYPSHVHRPRAQRAKKTAGSKAAQPKSRCIASSSDDDDDNGSILRAVPVASAAVAPPRPNPSLNHVDMDMSPDGGAARVQGPPGVGPSEDEARSATMSDGADNIEENGSETDDLLDGHADDRSQSAGLSLDESQRLRLESERAYDEDDRKRALLARTESENSVPRARASVRGTSSVVSANKHKRFVLRQHNGPGRQRQLVSLKAERVVFKRDEAHHELKCTRAPAGDTTLLGKQFKLEWRHATVREHNYRGKTHIVVGRRGATPPKLREGGQWLIGMSDVRVSRTACHVYYGHLHGETTVMPVGNTNVFIDGQPLAKHQEHTLLEGAELGFVGPDEWPAGAQPKPLYTFKFIETEQASPSKLAAAASTRQQAVVMRCGLRQISGRHAELLYHAQSNTWKIIDQKSTNGVYVNRLKINPDVWTPLSVGSEIVIGGYPPHFPVGTRLPKLGGGVYAFTLENAPENADVDSGAAALADLAPVHNLD